MMGDNYMDTHFVRIHDTPVIRPSKVNYNKINTRIKQPKGKESRGRL
ncbi:hypothetical protein J2Z76_000469 [Sedimentibacter acidaminivorans]|uniref:Uncharacterized protein n=1 Tax=Sedimentibacter acidaminivorans TaxID=913099 RepID=A0ABS4GAB0_9FIRM|nr:hypothetical protein [Sedimentibacter acidaminivorans]MBP1924616.1 hypothetical protein [Sedimentibacter acidaminivorans]